MFRPSSLILLLTMLHSSASRGDNSTSIIDHINRWVESAADAARNATMELEESLRKDVDYVRSGNMSAEVEAAVSNYIGTVLNAGENAQNWTITEFEKLNASSVDEILAASGITRLRLAGRAGN